MLLICMRDCSERVLRKTDPHTLIFLQPFAATDAVEISTDSMKDNGLETVFTAGVWIKANGFLAATDGAVTWGTGVKFATILTLRRRPVEYRVKTY